MAMRDARYSSNLPIMPETYDRVRGELRDENPLAPHAAAFGAGLIDPMGLAGYAGRGVASVKPEWLDPIKARWFADYMQEQRNRSPIAAGVGSSVLPFMLGGGVARGVGELTTREFFEGLPLFMQLGAGVGGLKGSVFPTQKQRPQAAYPPDGAY